MNATTLNQIFDKIQPYIKVAIWIGAIFAFLFVGKYLLNAATSFIQATRGLATALK